MNYQTIFWGEKLFFKCEDRVPCLAPAVNAESPDGFAGVFAVEVRAGAEDYDKFSGQKFDFGLQFHVVTVGFFAVFVRLHDIFDCIGIIIFYDGGEFASFIHLADIDFCFFTVPQSAFHIANYLAVEGVFYSVSHAESEFGVNYDH